MSNEWGNDWDWSASQNNYNQQQQAYNGGYGGGADHNDQAMQHQQPQANYYQQQQHQYQQQAPQADYYQNQQQSYGQQNTYGGDQFQASQNNAGFANPGFPGQQFMDPMMMNVAKQFGGQFAEQQKEKFSKYISGFNLKYYFAVDNLYVGKKLGILLFPFFHSEWAPKFSDSEPVPAREDVNAPDLYIPLMAFLTYVLVSGFVLGTQGRFSPEMLGILTSNAFIWIIIENIIIFVSKYIMNISQSMSVWHSLAYSTYKFVGMIICLMMFMAGGKTFYYCALAYTAAALSFFLLRTVKNFVFDSNHFGGDDGRKRKLMLIVFILVSQPLIMWWLTSGATSFEYAKYSWAQMAMSKMGAGDVPKADVPMMADGEVDYEALLKMPA